MISIDMIFMIILLYQIHIYTKVREHSISDPRVMIMIVGVFSSLNTFIHYGFLTPKMDGLTYFVIPLFQSIILISISLYYMNLASTFIGTYKQCIQRFLQIMYGLVILAILSIGIILTIGFNDND